MTDHGGDRVLQYATHDGLIEPSCPPALSPGTGLDAIIVQRTASRQTSGGGLSGLLLKLT